MKSTQTRKLFFYLLQTTYPEGEHKHNMREKLRGREQGIETEARRKERKKEKIQRRYRKCKFQE